MGIQNGCQLITYPDSLGRRLPELEQLLKTSLAGALRGIHLLPFFPSSGDRGFAPLTYHEVDPAFGTWEDVQRIGRQYDMIADFTINHLSRHSSYFQDFLSKGDDSPFADLFLRLSRMGGEGFSDEDMARVFRRKPGPPLIEVTLADGSSERLWCTFTDEQIDLNVSSQAGREFVRDSLLFLCRQGVKMIRLDAFAYVVKRPGTSCFFVEPETGRLLQSIKEILEPHAVELLPEIHAHHCVQLKLAAQGHYVYDFNLPLLALQALYDGSNRNLVNWLRICPRKQITTLDTHDGLPVLDVEDLMSRDDIERTKENLFSRGTHADRRYSVAPEYKNRNVYQLNSTYYSALAEDDDGYLTARAIQFFTPGIPQVYYVGLLAGRNDVELVESTRLGRNINRHNYSLAEVQNEVQRPVVQRLLRLMCFRNEYPVFDGEFSILPSAEHELHLSWRQGGLEAALKADLRRRKAVVEYRDAESHAVRQLSL